MTLRTPIGLPPSAAKTATRTTGEGSRPDGWRTFLYEDGPQTRTWAELHARAGGVAARLGDAGLVPGDRALLLFHEGLDYLDALFGCILEPIFAGDGRLMVARINNHAPGRTLPMGPFVRDPDTKVPTCTVPGECVDNVDTAYFVYDERDASGRVTSVYVAHEMPERYRFARFALRDTLGQEIGPSKTSGAPTRG